MKWVVVVVVVVVLAAARPAEACEQIAGPAFAFPSFPANGATDVPTNVTPFVSEKDATRVARTNLQLRNADAVAVDVTVTETRVTAFISSDLLLRLTPTAPLAPNAVHELVDDTGVIATFVTGAATDDTAPDAPDVDVTDLIGPDPDSTGFECSFPGQANLVVDAEAGSLLVVSLGEDPGFDAVLNAASLSDTLVVVSNDPVTAHVAVVDAAGQISLPTEIEVAIPPPVRLLRVSGERSAAAGDRAAAAASSSSIHLKPALLTWPARFCSIMAGCCSRWSAYQVSP